MKILDASKIRTISVDYACDIETLRYHEAGRKCSCCEGQTMYSDPGAFIYTHRSVEESSFSGLLWSKPYCSLKCYNHHNRNQGVS